MQCIQKDEITEYLIYSLCQSYQTGLEESLKKVILGFCV